jgi:hypothetical protein
MPELHSANARLDMDLAEHKGNGMGKVWLLMGATRCISAKIAKAVQAAPAAEFHRSAAEGARMEGLGP